jgi:REP element-mobilizing transposase RayT
MRQLRILGQGVWYEVRTRINNREPLFRRPNVLAIFAEVFRQTMLRFSFTIRDLSLEDDWLTFYIKPEDGLELPDIMKWMKQVFAQLINAAAGRIGHIWGDRYWSRIVEGEPVGVDTVEVPGVPLTNGTKFCGSSNGVRPYGTPNRVRPCWGRREERPCFVLTHPFPTAPAPG